MPKIIVLWAKSVDWTVVSVWSQVALARANVEKLEAEQVAKEAALRRAEAVEREAEQARQPKKRTPMKPKSDGTAAGEERVEKATE